MTSRDNIRQLISGVVNNQPLLDDFNLYDTSVTQKLWSVDHYVRQLIHLNINTFTITSSATNSSGNNIYPATTPVDIELYVRLLNLNLDGVFMNSESVFDTLAHLICTLYLFQGIPQKIYISTAERLLTQHFPQAFSAQLLTDILANGSWFSSFEPFRHCTTHESLIRYEDIQFSVDSGACQVQLTQPIRLPDNPQIRPLSYNQNNIATVYCQTLLSNIQQFTSDLFDAILLDIQACGNSLPIV